MEPVLPITGLTALHLAVIALIDVLSSEGSRARKLAWSVVIIGMPLIGAILYYRRAGRRPNSPARSGTLTAEVENDGGRAAGRDPTGPTGEHMG